MNRADWYAQKNGGGWRTARKDRRCDHVDQHGIRCTTVTLAGGRYFDTNARNFRSTCQLARVCICSVHANQELK